ncbi:helix-turn-helix domain-containing protein [Bacillus sp. BGMRC 2118]|nr:helix-turn-helix domain-containing protein [Bacillus sp. BGMRC 2118]
MEIKIGERIKSLRKQNGLTQKELAVRVNVSAQVVSNWEREYSFPDYDDVISLSNVLGVSTDYILGNTDDPNITPEGLITKLPLIIQQKIVNSDEDLTIPYIDGFITGYLEARMGVRLTFDFIDNPTLVRLQKKMLAHALVSDVSEETQRIEVYKDIELFKEALERESIEFKIGLLNIFEEDANKYNYIKENEVIYSNAKSELKTVTSVLNIPVLGFIAAGQPILAEEHILDYINIPNPGNFKEGDLFILIVKGDSMTGSRIYEGDKVVVKIQPEVENGEIAVVNVDGDNATLKKVKRYDDGSIWLISTNQNYAPIPLNNKSARIIGKVIQVIFEP